jgi:hypothetical protein
LLQVINTNKNKKQIKQTKTKKQSKTKSNNWQYRKVWS